MKFINFQLVIILLSLEYLGFEVVFAQENSNKLHLYLNKLFQGNVNIVPLIRKLEIPNNVSELCTQQTQYWFNQLNNNSSSNILEIETWALQMRDAWGKLPAGILRGHVNFVGDFDECIGIESVVKISTSETMMLSGKYCSVNFSPNLDVINITHGAENVHTPLVDKSSVSLLELMNHINTPFEGGVSLKPTLGVCFPGVCSGQDIQNIMTNFIRTNGLEQFLGPVTTSCTINEPVRLEVGEITMIILLSLLALLTLCGTFVEYLLKRHENMSSDSDNGNYIFRILLSFSLITNMSKLLSTKQENDSITCLHGIRFLTMCWVILGHTWFGLTMEPIWNTIDARMAYNDGLAMSMIHNFSVSVDTFFVISGLLVTFHLLKTLDKSNGKINIPLMYLHRYIRLTPPIAILIGITSTLMPLLGSGPNWSRIIYLSEFCKKSWWQNLLYINNFSGITKSGPFGNTQCFGHSWYVANDMQYYIFSPFLIYLIWRWKKSGILFLSLLTLSSMLIPALVTYYEDLLPTSIPRPGFNQYQTDGYLRPWMRFGPYCIGIWIGYFLYHYKNSSFKFSSKLLTAIWLIITCSCLAVILGPHSYWNINKNIDKLNGAIYAGFHRNIWSLSIGAIIFICAKGYGSLVQIILSWKLFLPLSRLTFCMYLVSWPLQMIYYLRVRQPIVYDAYSTVNLFFAHLVMSILVATICSLTMEIPFLRLEKIIFGGNTKKNTINNATALTTTAVDNASGSCNNNDNNSPSIIGIKFYKSSSAQI